VVEALIGLLVVTGLRVGEAIPLDTADVSLADGLLIVRHSKSGAESVQRAWRATAKQRP